MKFLAEELLLLLVCPECHAPVLPGPSPESHRWLRCIPCDRYYPVVDGIPVMIAERATTMPPQ